MEDSTPKMENHRCNIRKTLLICGVVLILISIIWAIEKYNGPSLFTTEIGSKYAKKYEDVFDEKNTYKDIYTDEGIDGSFFTFLKDTFSEKYFDYSLGYYSYSYGRYISSHIGWHYKPRFMYGYVFILGLVSIIAWAAIKPERKIDSIVIAKPNPPIIEQPASAANEIETLNALKNMLDSGVISQDEFDAKKKEILNL